MLFHASLGTRCASTNAIASCCNTVMFIDHPAYAGNGVMTFNTIVPAQNAEVRLISF